jgi:hypothetical protein
MHREIPETECLFRAYTYRDFQTIMLAIHYVVINEFIYILQCLAYQVC